MNGTLLLTILIELCQMNWVGCRLNEEMIETLFVVNTPNPKPKDATLRSVLPSSSQEERVLDPKKSQNIAILLRALNVTIEEVCEALLEGIFFIPAEIDFNFCSFYVLLFYNGRNVACHF